MSRIHREALLPYSAERIFDLINDVERYPEFMDGCSAATILEQDDERMVARLELQKSFVRQSFTTENRLQRPERISLRLVDGPFEALEGEWLIRALGPDGCKVTLDLQVKSGDSLIMRAAVSLFEQTANRLVDAVSARAEKLYGGGDHGA